MGGKESVPLITKKSTVNVKTKKPEEINNIINKDETEIWLSNLGLDQLHFSEILTNLKLISLNNDSDEKLIPYEKFQNMINLFFQNEKDIGEKLFNFYDESNDYFHKDEDEKKFFDLNKIENSLFLFTCLKKMKIKNDYFLTDKSFYIFQQLPKIGKDNNLVIKKEDYENYLREFYINALKDFFIIYQINGGKLKGNYQKIFDNIKEEEEKIIDYLIDEDPNNNLPYYTIYDINQKFLDNNNYLMFTDIMKKCVNVIKSRNSNLDDEDYNELEKKNFNDLNKNNNVLNKKISNENNNIEKGNYLENEEINYENEEEEYYEKPEAI